MTDDLQDRSAVSPQPGPRLPQASPPSGPTPEQIAAVVQGIAGGLVQPFADAEKAKAEEATKQITIEHSTRRIGLIGGMAIAVLTLGGAFAVLIVKGDHETFRLVLTGALSFLGGLGLGSKLRS